LSIYYLRTSKILNDTGKVLVLSNQEKEKERQNLFHELVNADKEEILILIYSIDIFL
jgi:hypothetical protein